MKWLSVVKWNFSFKWVKVAMELLMVLVLQLQGPVQL
jgi:hypothetical protein